MKMGEAKTFHLPNALAIDSAAVTAAHMGKLDGCKYSCSRDYVENSITVTKQMI